MPTLKEILEGTASALTFTAFFTQVVRRVNQGAGSPAEKILLAKLEEVVKEYEVKSLLAQKTMEAAELQQRQQRFNEKWGITPLPKIGITGMRK